MDKKLLEVNKRRLLDAWNERGHLKDLLNLYKDNPEEVLGKIIINGEFKLDLKDVWINIGQVPVDCFTENSQRLLEIDPELEDYIDFNNEDYVFLTSHNDKIFENKGEKNILVAIQL